MSDTTKLVLQLQKSLEARGQTLACAESCTGGLLSASISAQPGVSKFFLGAVVSYHRRVKNRILGVPMTLLHVMGEVSTPVALEMARGVREELGSDWAVAITGVAGPSGGTPEKPVGMVCFAVAGPGHEQVITQHFSPTERQKIQKQSVDFALEMLLKSL